MGNRYRFNLIKNISITLTLLILTSCGSTSEFTSNVDSSLDSSISPSDGILESSLILKNTDEFKEEWSLNSTGTQKILVVPVVFKGETDFTSEQLDLLNKAFFSSNLSSINDNYYYSVNEYYTKSSFNKLNIEGEVTSTLYLDDTVADVEESGLYFPGVPALSLYNSTSYSDSLFKEYDSDNDGYIDATVFVYSNASSSRSGNFWAWVNTFASNADISRPIAKRHMWVGIDFLTSDEYSIDAHTLIHETGHLFSLRDYYPSDNNYLALGGTSMMDYNILDLDPYSKMLLNWIDPIYYDFKNYSKITVDLKPFENSNNVLLINPSWNHSVMDEYLLVEFYTPNGLNYLDSKTKYQNRPIGYSKPGIKIYHIDSRIAKCKLISTEYYSSLNFEEYVNEIPTTKSSDDIYYVIGASNSNSDSRTNAKRTGTYKQIALVENKEYSSIFTGTASDDSSLFYEGDSFNSKNSIFFTKNKWNNGEEMYISISVNSLSNNNANLTITIGE